MTLEQVFERATEGQSLRSNCGNARVEYSPSWSPSRPYLTFANGEAGDGFASSGLAIQRLKDKGFRFSRDTKWQ